MGNFATERSSLRRMKPPSTTVCPLGTRRVVKTAWLLTMGKVLPSGARTEPVMSENAAG